MGTLARWLGMELDPGLRTDATGSDCAPNFATEGALDRRRREASPAELQVQEAIAEKILHAWLQNRQQTLMPLSVSLGRLQAPDRVLVAQFTALAVLAGGDEAARDQAGAWLSTIGAD